MFIKFETNNDSIRIDSQIYEFDKNVGSDELELFIHHMLTGKAASEKRMLFKVGNSSARLKTSLYEHTVMYLPHEAIEEITFVIYYDLLEVEIMEFLKLENNRCLGQCGKNMHIKDNIIFEKATISYKGARRPAIAVVKNHGNGKTCRIGFVRTSDYGGIDSCTEWLGGRTGTMIELYVNSDEKSKRALYRRNCGMGLVELN